MRPDDIITSVVFLPFSYSPPLTVFPATGLLSRPRPLFIPISPWYYHATIQLLTCAVFPSPTCPLPLLRLVFIAIPPYCPATIRLVP
eukprot:g59595.t1